MPHTSRMTARLLLSMLLALSMVLGSLPASAAPLQPLAPALAPTISGGPDSYGYTFKDSNEAGGPTYSWIEIVGSGGTRLDAGDQSSSNVTSPFPILFYGVMSTALSVAGNGAIRFNSSGTTVSDNNVALNDASTPNLLLAAFWDDMGTATSPAGVYWGVVGTAPNRQLVIEWKDMPRFSVFGNPASFQIIFTENSQDILFQYQDVDFGNASYTNGASATVGIRGNSAAQLLQYSRDQAVLASNLAIRFSGPPMLVVNPTSASKTAAPGTSATYDLMLTNFTGSADTFSMSYSGGPYIASGPSSVTLNNGESAVVQVNVAVPANPSPPYASTNVVSLSGTGGTHTATSTLNTTAGTSFACSPVPATLGSSNGATVTLPLTVTGTPVVNGLMVSSDVTTSIADRLRLELTSPSGRVVRLHNQTTTSLTGIYPTTLPVDGPGALSDFNGELGNGTWTLKYTNVNGFSTSQINSCAITFSPTPTGIYLASANQTKIVAPGALASYQLTAVNNTDQTQIFNLSYAGSLYQVSGPTSVVVNAGQTVSFMVDVQTDTTAPLLQPDVLTVSASSAAGTASATLRTIMARSTAGGWEYRQPMGVQRGAVTVASDGRYIYAFGGRNGSNTAGLSSMEVYDPQTNTWVPGPAMPGGKHSARSAVMNGLIFVVGGEINATATNSTYTFFPTSPPGTGFWGTAATLNTAVAFPVVVADPVTANVYSFGGRTGGSTATGAVQVYTPNFSGGTWTTLPATATMPLALGRAVGTRLGRNVYITGGIVSGGFSTNASLLIFNLDTKTWSTGPDIPVARNFSSMVAMGSSVCTAGGQVSSAQNATSYCYDTLGGSWYQISHLNTARQYLDVVAGPDGIYAIGGETNIGNTTNACAASGTAYCGTVERYVTQPARLAGSSKGVTPSTVSAGELVTYTLHISNSGQISATVSLTDVLNPALTPETLPAQLTNNGGTLTGQFAINPNTLMSLQFTARVNIMFSGTITNTFTLTGDGVLRSFQAPTLMVNAASGPTAGFTSSSPDTLGQTTQFTSTSSDATSFHWDFGDGSTSALEHPSHAYQSAGSFTVTLTVTDVNGLADTTTDVVTIVSAPVAGFSSSSPDSLGQTTSFTNTTSGTGLSYSWNFGDGNTSTATSPTHTYAAAGTYTVTLTATDANSFSDVFTATVQIVALPVAGFSSSSPDSLGQTTSFTNTSTGTGLSYSWSFGDGNTSTATNPIRTYAAAGTYTVVLTVTDANNVSDVFTATVQIIALPVASFTSSSPDTVGQTTQFTNTSTGAALSYQWNFGDGSPTTNVANPTHAYASPGTYQVTLTVTDTNNQTDSETLTVTIVAAPSVTIGATPEEVGVGETVTFTSTATGTGLTYHWDFDDGSTSTAANPTHSYAATGQYGVELTVTDANGVQATDRLTIVVIELNHHNVFIPIIFR